MNHINYQVSRQTYAAIVDIGYREVGGAYAYAIFKQTYEIGNGICGLIEPEPLFHDIRDEEIKPRIRSDSDFWDVKEKTDVVVQGSAFSPDGTLIPEMMVSLRMGRFSKYVQVYGERSIVWNASGYPTIQSPKPFKEIPMTYANAYGGLDWRVIDPTIAKENVKFCTESDHPGMYPRNPFGKGYLVVPGEVPDMLMPSLENPNDLLTASRLITKDPKLWYRQPLPWCFDWTHPMTFPRYLWADPDINAWYPVPDDVETSETNLGYLSANYRDEAAEYGLLAGGPHSHFYQGGSYGMIFDNIPSGCEVQINGMHPTKPTIHFTLPELHPTIQLKIDNKHETVQTRLHHIVIRPAELKLNLVFASSMPLHRTYIPGIHKNIPISASFNFDDPIEYEAPTLIHEKVKNASKT